jgi:hypothetical protein
MEELQRVFGYLQKYTGGSIPLTLRTIRKGDCIYYRTTMVEFYPDASEDIPNDMLGPRMEARLTVYVDADHARNKCHAVQSQGSYY